MRKFLVLWPNEWPSIAMSLLFYYYTNTQIFPFLPYYSMHEREHKQQINAYKELNIYISPLAFGLIYKPNVAVSN